MSRIIPILNFEEGYRARPYLDTEGYPTVGTGFLIGPKGADISNYTFTLPKNVSDVWLQELVDSVISQCNTNPLIYAALKQCNPARADIIYSMAFNLGISGLAGFKNTLVFISNGNFNSASTEMLNSRWAKQVPARARRHCLVIRSGNYEAYEGLL